MWLSTIVARVLWRKLLPPTASDDIRQAAEAKISNAALPIDELSIQVHISLLQDIWLPLLIGVFLPTFHEWICELRGKNNGKKPEDAKMSPKDLFEKGWTGHLADEGEYTSQDRGDHQGYGPALQLFSFTPTLVLVGIVPIVVAISYKLSMIVTAWENHPTKRSYENSLTLKILWMMIIDLQEGNRSPYLTC
jgi:hypothetical protein